MSDSSPLTLRIPTVFAVNVGSLTTKPLFITLLFVGVYLLLGCIMETAAILIMTDPVVLPLTTSVGIDSIFFGLLVCICLSIGTLIPPLEIVMFVMCEFGIISVEHFSRIVLPFLALLIGVILLLTLFPSLVLFCLIC